MFPQTKTIQTLFAQKRVPAAGLTLVTAAMVATARAAMVALALAMEMPAATVVPEQVALGQQVAPLRTAILQTYP